MRYSDLMEGGFGSDHRNFKRQELEYELRHEVNPPAPRRQSYAPSSSTAPKKDIQMTALHYFPMNDQDRSDFSLMKFKQDRKGNWYLPQYNVSGATFEKNFDTLQRTFGQPRTVRL